MSDLRRAQLRYDSLEENPPLLPEQKQILWTELEYLQIDLEDKLHEVEELKRQIREKREELEEE